MTEELKPCPFCGQSYFGMTEGTYGDNFVKQCCRNPGCEAEGPVVHSKNGRGYDRKGANKAWNTRFTSPDTVVLPKGVVEEIKVWAERGLKNEDTDYRRKMFNQIIELTEQGK